MKSNLIPSNFIIGLQRAGSTYCHGLLKSHPEISLSRLKEIGFYSDIEKYEKGLNWYLETFEGQGEKIDISPKYFMKSKEVIPRMKEKLLNIHPKFLLILRNPIYYIYSHFKYHIGYNYFKSNRDLYPVISKDLITFMKLYPDYLERGDYFNILVNDWFNQFDPSLFKIIIFEDFINDKDKFIKKLCEFFGFNNLILTNNPIDQNARKPFKVIYNATEFVSKYPKIKNSLYNNKMFVKVYKSLIQSIRDEPTEREIEFLKNRYLKQVKSLSEIYPECLHYWDEFKI